VPPGYDPPVSVAAFGRILACLTLASCADDPPPRPRPPAPPPTAASPRTPPSQIEWEGSTGVLRCRSTRIEIPTALAGQVRQIAPDELAIIPSGSPPGGALLVTVTNDDWDTGLWDFFEAFPEALMKLHRLASGGEELKKDTTLDVDPTSWLGPHRMLGSYAVEGRRAKVVYLEANHCRIGALDYPVSTTEPSFTEALEDLDVHEIDLSLPLPFALFERR
jgi:hypothetical protein